MPSSRQKPKNVIRKSFEFSRRKLNRDVTISEITVISESSIEKSSSSLDSLETEVNRIQEDIEAFKAKVK